MKILLVMHEFFCDGATHHGGIATYYKTLAEILSRNDNEIKVITLSDIYDDVYVWNEIEVYRVKLSGWLYKLRKVNGSKCGEYFLGAILVRLRINQIMKKWKPDIIHYANFKSVGYFRRYDIPTVIRISSDNVLWRETFLEEYHFEEAFGRVNAEDRMEIKTLKRADCLFAPSNLVAKITERRIFRTVKVIDTPVILPQIVDDSIYRQELQGKKYFLYYGSLSRMKGIHVIAEILEKFLALNKDTYFVFIGHDYGIRRGSGEKISVRDYVFEKATTVAERIRFIDSVQPEKLIAIIKNAYACVFPSRIDNLPNTCLEAMMMKKVIIATRGASFEQLIEDHRSGFLIEIDNSEQLLRTLEEVCNMSDLERIAMGEQAYQRRLDSTPEKIYLKVRAIYGEAIQNHEENSKRISKIHLS